MKIGTDGVLIGAWSSAPDPKKILDVGCGTGLIALQLAQRFLFESN
jgi:tRNA1Val (adenine37-N6)-methyltransferase